MVTDSGSPAAITAAGHRGDRAIHPHAGRRRKAAATLIAVAVGAGGCQGNRKLAAGEPSLPGDASASAAVDSTAAASAVDGASSVVARWATWPMPNSVHGLPNPQSFDTSQAGVVTDRVTGLMWQRDLDGSLLTSADAKDRCNRLTLAGYDDWRLPSRIELISILDASRVQPSINVDAFPQTPNDWFWTSSVAADNPQAAWFVYFYFGYPKTDLMSNQFSSRCVRTSQQRSNPEPRYDVQSETVRDLGTGLTWQRAVPGQTFVLDGARAYCANLSLGGAKGWRVPSMVELLTLIDESATAGPMIDWAAFPNTPSEAFWTSSNFGGVVGMAWQVYFDHGNGLYGLPNAMFRVRCVQ